MNWKFKENIRLNKACSTCYYGTKINRSDIDIDICTYKILENNYEHPETSPRIKTCLKWTSKRGDRW